MYIFCKSVLIKYGRATCYKLGRLGGKLNIVL